MMYSPAFLEEKPRLVSIARVCHGGGEYQYLLPSHWSLHFYEYHGQLLVDGTVFELYPGSLSLVPPNALIEYRIPPSGLHYAAHFTLPEPLHRDPVMLRVFYDVRGEVHRFEQSVIAIGRAFLYRNNSLQAEIGLWNLLWELSTYGGNALGERHASLEKALGLIDSRLGEPISISSLAHEVGVSRNHLTRLFRREKELTVVAYVRQQRARRAKHLLENTTMSLRSIAIEINMPNLQSFSALMKKETGHPPGYWRRHREQISERD